jgi:hypothetical protein
MIVSFANKNEDQLSALIAAASTADLQHLVGRLREVQTRLERLINWGVDIIEPGEVARAVEACAMIDQVESSLVLLATIEKAATPDAMAMRDSLAKRLGADLAGITKRLTSA